MSFLHHFLTLQDLALILNSLKTWVGSGRGPGQCLSFFRGQPPLCHGEDSIYLPLSAAAECLFLLDTSVRAWPHRRDCIFWGQAHGQRQPPSLSDITPQLINEALYFPCLHGFPILKGHLLYPSLPFIDQASNQTSYNKWAIISSFKACKLLNLWPRLKWKELNNLWGFRWKKMERGASKAAMMTEHLSGRLTTWASLMFSLSSGAFLFGHAAVGSDGLHVLDLNDQSNLSLEEQVTNVCTKKRGVVTEWSPPKHRHLGVDIYCAWKPCSGGPQETLKNLGFCYYIKFSLLKAFCGFTFQEKNEIDSLQLKACGVVSS